MTDYQVVAKALAEGTEPGMLCSTCPWDRYCLTPPTMSKADVDKAIREAGAADDKAALDAVAAGKPAPMPTGSLLTALLIVGRDQQAYVCPVLSLRLRSSAGRGVADGLKGQMQGWDDQA